MPIIWGRWHSEEEIQQMSEELNRPRTGLNIEKLAEDLRRAANAADKVGEAYKIIKEAKARNPRGLMF